MSRRPHCDTCDRPRRSCLCALVRAVPSRLPLRVLQHPGEQAHAKGTVRLLQRCLGDRCEVHTGLTAPPAWQADPGGWLLYPGDGPPPPGRPRHLLLLDGSWRQSRQLLHLNPWLHELPRYALPPDLAPAPRYAVLRRAQRPGQLSSLEAAAWALGALDGNEVGRDQLLQAMDEWLRLQQALRPALLTPPANAPGRPPGP